MILALYLIPSSLGSRKNVRPIRSCGSNVGSGPSLSNFDFKISSSSIGSRILFFKVVLSALLILDLKMIFDSSDNILKVSACPTVSATPTNLPNFSDEL